jgi:hypothetical protein
MRYGYTEAKAAWKELRFEQVYTLYPDGSVFLAYTLEKDEPSRSITSSSSRSRMAHGVRRGKVREKAK